MWSNVLMFFAGNQKKVKLKMYSFVCVYIGLVFVHQTNENLPALDPVEPVNDEHTTI